ncbi:hypothetical protein GWI33_015910 [Rhynchophorus ferrugineus]|uniref:Uncharacterized protein n=1 Tax=Rhynchophorus ferrugineus TaxID=354439 RepID=A0A834M981_RHYFE|nr:hypothetical protein GWI33_015910 [Rhynchophorus ferrugineus]
MPRHSINLINAQFNVIPTEYLIGITNTKLLFNRRIEFGNGSTCCVLPLRHVFRRYQQFDEHLSLENLAVGLLICDRKHQFPFGYGGIEGHAC